MSEWVTAPLWELADIRVSNVDKKSLPSEHPVRLCNYMDVYSNNYIRSDISFMVATANAAEIFRFKVELGDVMITKDSETPSDIGIPAVVTEQIDDLVCGYHLALLKPNRRIVDSVYLAKQLATDETARYFGRYAAGSTRYGLSNGAIANTRIRLAPLHQQQKIAAILTSIDTAIEKTEALIEKYQQIKAGLMHDLFTRGVLPNGQLRPPREQAPELYQETAIGWIPNEWSADRLAVYLDPANGIKPGPFGSSLTKDQYTSAGFRIYGQEQVIAGSLAIGGYYISAAKFAEMRAFEVVENDVLLSLVGTVGCVLVVSAPFEPGIINPRLIRLRPAPKKVSADFLRYLLLTNNVGRQIDNLSGGGTMPVINGKVIRRIAVPIVSISEQALIVARLGALERQLSSAISQLSKLKSQKLGLMQDLMTGKVPVKVGAVETANG